MIGILHYISNFVNKYKKMVSNKKNQNDENKQIIFKIVKDLGKCSPKEIKKIMDILAKKIAEEDFAKGVDENEKEKTFKKTQ